jgi:hypothetical protein
LRQIVTLFTKTHLPPCQTTPASLSTYQS